MHNLAFLARLMKDLRQESSTGTWKTWPAHGAPESFIPSDEYFEWWHSGVV